MAVWSQKWFIVIPLIVLILGHWSLLMHGECHGGCWYSCVESGLLGVLLKAEWVQGGCAIIYTNTKILAASFIYGMAFDFVVLSLTAWKLAFPSGGRSKLINLIFGDGLIYFLLAYVEHYPTPLESGLTAPQIFVQSPRNDLHDARPQRCHVHHCQRSGSHCVYGATSCESTSSASHSSSDCSFPNSPPLTQLLI